MLPASVESNVEQYLKKTCRAPRPRSHAQRGERLRDGVGRRDRARLERDDDRVGIAVDAVAPRHADRLDGAHAALDQHVREVGRAGEVVGDAAKEHGVGEP